jgi:hypothetical protein
MTVDTVIWAAVVAVVIGTLGFVVVGGALTGFIEGTWDEIPPAQRPPWRRRLKRAVDVVLWLLATLFLLLFLRQCVL